MLEAIDSLMSAAGRFYPFAQKALMTASSCGFNWSMQHLISKYREEDVENEVSTKNLLHRRTEGIDVGSLAER
jgi:hypothetical protein